MLYRVLTALLACLVTLLAPGLGTNLENHSHVGPATQGGHYFDACAGGALEPPGFGQRLCLACLAAKTLSGFQAPARAPIPTLPAVSSATPASTTPPTVRLAESPESRAPPPLS
jgi:hypothetical protein